MLQTAYKHLIRLGVRPPLLHPQPHRPLHPQPSAAFAPLAHRLDAAQVARCGRLRGVVELVQPSGGEVIAASVWVEKYGVLWVVVWRVVGGSEVCGVEVEWRGGQFAGIEWHGSMVGVKEQGLYIYIYLIYTPGLGRWCRRHPCLV